MAIHVQRGISATSLSTLLFVSMPLVPTSISSCVTQGKTTYTVLNHVSPSSVRQAQPGIETCSRMPGRSYSEVQGNLKQRSEQVGFSLTQLMNETVSKAPQICHCDGQGSFKQRSGGGDEDVLVLHGEGHGVSREQQVTAYEDDKETQMLLSLSTCSDDKRVFIFGFGYTSCALASNLKENNWKVSGTCRSDERRAVLKQCGYSIHLFNSDNDGEALRDDGLQELQLASHWLTSVPPVADFDRDPVLATHVQDLKRAVENGTLCWIGYLSSTGVYGDWHGNWVDEDSEPRPVEHRAVARLAAEKSWLKFGEDHGVPVHIFRLGGIYGPGRSALDTILQKGALSGRQRSRGGRRFTSRIHVADICQTVLASMQNPHPGTIYNVVDDDPAPRMEVLAYAQDLLNNQSQSSDCYSPSTANMVSSPNMALGGTSLSGGTAEKRVSNTRVKEELKIRLLYPTYRSGLLAILEAHLEANNCIA